jgi:hypothetical protein
MPTNVEFDAGPPPVYASLFDRVPDYSAYSDDFWLDWGPVFYRGRLDHSARLLCIASDPGATERVAGRTLVGNAGQRVQGFLSKLGLTRSYLCLNAFAYALFPSQANRAPQILADPAQLAWRNELYDSVRAPALECVVAFGVAAQEAVRLWPGKGQIPVVEVPHPTSHDEPKLLREWRAAVTQLRKIVTPDSQARKAANYGTTFREADYVPIPRRDLPYGLPAFVGDDAWLRRAQPPRNSSVFRPTPDDRHTLTWIAPAG